MSNKHEPTAPAAEHKTGTEVAIYELGADAGAGMENLRREEYAIPFIKIVNADSPVAAPISAGGLGLKPGTFYNTATGEIIDGEAGFDFIPAYRYSNFVEQYPYESGKGFIGIRKIDDPEIAKLMKTQDKFKQHGFYLSKRGDDVIQFVETNYIYAIMLDSAGHSVGWVIFRFKSTQIKKYQGLMTRLMNLKVTGRLASGDVATVQASMWMHICHAGIMNEKKGVKNFYGWKLDLKTPDPANCRLLMSDSLYKEGRLLYDTARSSTDKLDAAEAAASATDADEEVSL